MMLGCSSPTELSNWDNIQSDDDCIPGEKAHWGNMFMKVNGHVEPSSDDQCKVLAVASLVNHPRFFLRLSLLVLLMVFVMREMNNS